MGLSVTNLSLVSLTAGNVLGNDDTTRIALSADGTKALLTTRATNFGFTDGNAATDIYLKDLVGGSLTLVSTSATGEIGNSTSDSAFFSADGNTIYFASNASNLVSGDTNGVRDLFAKDLSTGTVTLLSAASDGTLGNGLVANAHLSANGQYLVYTGLANNLVSGDTNGVSDIFLRDMISGTVTRVSTTSTGTEANGPSDNGFISADGSKLLFTSDATNLVAGDTNARYDVFMKDLLTGTVTRVSTSSSSVQGNGHSVALGFSPDGTKLAFLSHSTNLVTGDTNNFADLFIKDIATGTTTRVSTGASNVQGNGVAYSLSFLSNDTILFTSGANNLVTGDTNAAIDAFYKQLSTGETARISASSAGVQGNGATTVVAASANGVKVGMISVASNLVTGDTNGKTDAFVINLLEDQTLQGALGDTTLTGTEGNDMLNDVFGKLNFVTDGYEDEDGFFVVTSATVETLLGGNDSLTGLAGNDYLLGYDGNDYYSGGDGNDTLQDAASDFIEEEFQYEIRHGDGEGGYEYYTLPVYGSYLFLSGNDTMDGGKGNDFILSYEGDDSILGGDGNDTIDSGPGKDTVYGGAGDDSITDEDSPSSDPDSLPSGDDTIYGEGGNDFIESTDGLDLVYGGVGQDTIIASGTIDGGEDNDKLTASGSVEGGHGNDTLIGSGWLSGGIGHDSLTGTGTLLGGDGTDYLFNSTAGGTTSMDGGIGDDTILASSGNVTMLGGQGNDSIEAGTGSNLIQGGEGNDRLQLKPGSQNSTVMGEAGNDTVNFYSNSYWIPASSTLNAFTGDTVNIEGFNQNLATLDGGGDSDTLAIYGTNVALNMQDDSGESPFARLNSFESFVSYASRLILNLTGSIEIGAVTITGGTGGDTIWSGNGNDSISGAGGNDTIRGSGGLDTIFGNDGNDTLRGDGGNDSLSGGVNDDDVRGGLGNDRIEGNDGNDTLRGDEGNDTLEGGIGDDDARGGIGLDSISGGEGNDRLHGEEGTDTVLGGAGNDTLRGDEGNDTLLGEADNDDLQGGAGSNSLTGGAGTDRFTIGDDTVAVTDTIADFQIAADTVGAYEKIDLSAFGSNLSVTLVASGDTDTSFTLGNRTVLLKNVSLATLKLDHFIGVSTLVAPPNTPTANNDNLTGTVGNDSISGLEGNDTISALAGNDTLNGGLGADSMDGGDGIDTVTYAGSNAGVSVNLKPGGTNTGGWAAGDVITNVENLIGSALADNLIGNFANNSIYGGAGNDTINGGTDDASTPLEGADTGNDVLFGEAGNDILDGKDGNDSLNGGDDNDTLRGGTGNDTIYGGNGADSLNGQAGDDYLAGQDSNGSVNTGNDTLFGGDGNDTVIGSGGNDSVNGESGNDVVEGKDGNDRVFGGDGMDTVRGGIGNDSVFGGFGNDSLAGQGGDDQMFGQDGSDSLDGGEGNNLLYGDDSVTSSQPGDDTIIGGSGLDTLYGGLGSDRLTGKGGVDQLYGGAGNDFFIFLSGHSTATARDTIHDFTIGQDKIDLTGIAAIDVFTDLTVTQESGITRVTWGTGSSFSVDLAGSLALSGTDFLFG